VTDVQNPVPELQKLWLARDFEPPRGRVNELYDQGSHFLVTRPPDERNS